MERILSFTILLVVMFYASPSTAAAWIEWNCEKNERSESCAQNGKVKYIYIYDEIDSETFARIASFDGLLKENSKFPVVYLNSFGGSLRYSKAIGRILRRRGASVESKNVFFPKQRPTCDSGCVLIAAGAIDRQLSEIGLHRASLNIRVKGEVYRQEPSNDGDEDVRDYYAEMGITPRINEITSPVPHTDILRLRFNPDEPAETQEIVRLGFRMRPEAISKDTDISSASSKSEGGSSLAAAAERGDAEAALLLGRLFFYGTSGHIKDTTRGLYWFKRAVELGSANAGHWLGVIYSDWREGVDQN